GKRRALPKTLEPLSTVDWQMIERQSETIAIENLEEDLKLMTWRSVFGEFGLRSLLVCNTAIGKSLEAIVVVGHEATRSWHHSERELVQVVSQQIGLLMHQLQLQRQADQLQKNYQAMQWGLTSMQKMGQLERLEQTATQQIAQILQAPLVTLVTWQPGYTSARIAAPQIKHQQTFGVIPDVLIPLQSDALMQATLQAEGLTLLSGAEITAETRYWLSGSEIGQVLAIALRTDPDHEPTAILLIGDTAQRQWSEPQMTLLGLLAIQLAWCRRNLMLTGNLVAQRSTLEQLNWYKQRRLEELYRTLGMAMRRLNELSSQQEALANLRYPQIMRHLGVTLSAMAPLLKHEQWQFHSYSESIPLASLLKRSLERADTVIKQRQLWSQVHNEANVNVAGDISKIEFVLHEVLTSACARSSIGGRLDIWCRQNDPHFLDLSITDNGSVDPNLVEELEKGRIRDLLMPSVLDQPPGLHLAICQALMRRLGGELHLYQTEDNRVVSRLLIPIGNG
ncbi:MAG: histidine kinase, partial [Oculatellaceae cyanobacterium Prado106]|nr:histidine kinase [Oculatellaceae cyanobacterium Prado106]